MSLCLVLPAEEGSRFCREPRPACRSPRPLLLRPAPDGPRVAARRRQLRRRRSGGGWAQRAGEASAGAGHRAGGGGPRRCGHGGRAAVPASRRPEAGRHGPQGSGRARRRPRWLEGLHRRAVLLRAGRALRGSGLALPLHRRGGMQPDQVIQPGAHGKQTTRRQFDLSLPQQLSVACAASG